MSNASPGARNSALIALVLMSLIWSYNWIVMKAVLAYIGPFEFSALRYVCGNAVLFLLLVLRRESLRPPPWRYTLAIGLAQTMGFQALVQLALVHGGAGKTAMLAYTMPFWVIPLAWLWLGERPGARQWMCIPIAAAGLILIMQPWHALGEWISSLLALAGGFCWAVGTVLSKSLFQKAAVSPLRLTAWQMLIGTTVLCVFAGLAHEPTPIWSAVLIGALVYNGLLASGIAWALWLFVVQRLPAGVAGLASLSTPILGVLLAWLLLGERPDLTEAAGMLLVGLALYGVLKPRRLARP